MPDIHLIAIDLDGTLFRPDQSVSPEDISALRQAMAQGIQIVLCSGRLGFMLRELGQALLPGTPLPLIGLNGAQVFLPDGSSLQQSRIENTEARRIVSLLLAEKIPFLLYEEARLYAGILPPLFWPLLNAYRALGTPYRLLDAPAAELLAQTVSPLKVNCQCLTPQAQSRIWTALEEIPSLELSSSWHSNIEITRSSANKGTALEALCGALRIAPQTVMAIGDNENDLPMFRIAGLSVAMGNASAAVQRQATYITAGNAHSGVGLAVRRYALGESL